MLWSNQLEHMNPDDLITLKDDMVAFIEGHGMRRFQAYIGEDMNSVMWEAGENPDSWKDYVEVAKASGAAFLTMNEFVLRREDLDFLVERLRYSPYMNTEDLEDARWLRSYEGRTGYLQLGWPYQGVLFVYEVSTEWYERYQRLLDLAEESGIMIDEHDQDDER
jgi:hypothetical protein